MRYSIVKNNEVVNVIECEDQITADKIASEMGGIATTDANAVKGATKNGNAYIKPQLREPVKSPLETRLEMLEDKLEAGRVLTPQDVSELRGR